jgi:hypothetical protein
MPVPRNDDASRHGDKWSDGHIPRPAGTGLPQGRTLTEAEAQRRYRAGIRVGSGGLPPLTWTERNPRLALPFKPYVYRGTGADAFTGEVVQ